MEYVPDGLRDYKKVQFSLILVLMTGVEIPVGLAKGSMRIPESDVPCIFVGPGTGIAPMRAMIEQRMLQRGKGMAIAPPL
jgi:sulfite reductase alpha subunit-like flavoprotein